MRAPDVRPLREAEQLRHFVGGPPAHHDDSRAAGRNDRFQHGYDFRIRNGTRGIDMERRKCPVIVEHEQAARRVRNALEKCREIQARR